MDAVIEAVGTPQTLGGAFRIIRPGGHVANTGVHSTPMSLPIHELWVRNITFSTGLVDCTSIPMFIEMTRTHQIQPAHFATHRFGLHDMMDAYECFENSPTTRCLKPLISR